MSGATSKVKPLRTQTLRKSLAVTAAMARKWFEERATLKTAEQFKARGGLGDKHMGAVYVYFDAQGRALYVGETGGGVKARTHFPTSPHKNQPWWKRWTHIRFVAMPDAADRLTLESLLIAIYEPSENKKPRAKRIGRLFPS
jgi:hypothetical protein